MKKDKWTEIVCILDRSGSMGSLESDTIGGFNAFIEQQQKEEGRARLTLVLFDDRYEVPWKHVDLQAVPKLDDRLYFVRGSTALLDALGNTINGVGGKLMTAHEDERPDHVVVLVMTDGHENASKEYTAEQVRALVAKVQAEGWEFVFIGANIDSFSTAEGMAMATGSASNVAHTSMGTREAYSKLNRALKQIRRTGQKGDVDAPLDEDGWL